MTRTKHARAPRRNCRECGKRVYSWNPTPICGACTPAVSELLERARGPESIRALVNSRKKES